MTNQVTGKSVKDLADTIEQKLEDTEYLVEYEDFTLTADYTYLATGANLHQNCVNDDTENVYLYFTNNIDIHEQMVQKMMKLIYDNHPIKPELWITTFFNEFPVHTYARYSNTNDNKDDNNTMVNFISVILGYDETKSVQAINQIIDSLIEDLQINQNIYGEQEVQSLIKKMQSGMIINDNINDNKALCTINIEDINILMKAYNLNERVLNMLKFLLENYIIIFTSFMHRIIYNIIIPSKLMVGGNLISTNDYASNIYNLYSHAEGTLLPEDSIYIFMELLFKYTSPRNLLFLSTIKVDKTNGDILNEDEMDCINDEMEWDYIFFPTYISDSETWQLIVVDMKEEKVIGYIFDDELSGILLQTTKLFYTKFFKTKPTEASCVIHYHLLENRIYNSGICILMYMDLIAYAHIYKIIRDIDIKINLDYVEQYRAKVCWSLNQNEYYTLLPRIPYELPYKKICSVCKNDIEDEDENPLIQEDNNMLLCSTCLRKESDTGKGKKSNSSVMLGNTLTPTNEDNNDSIPYELHHNKICSVCKNDIEGEDEHPLIQEDNNMLLCSTCLRKESDTGKGKKSNSSVMLGNTLTPNEKTKKMKSNNKDKTLTPLRKSDRILKKNV